MGRSLKSRAKRVVRKVIAPIKKYNAIKTSKKLLDKTGLGGMFGGGDKDKGDDGMRSEAASRLVNKQRSQQAGSGQISYMTQEEEQA